MACNFVVCSHPTQCLAFVIVNLSLTAVYRKVIQKVTPEVFMYLQPLKISIGKIFVKLQLLQKLQNFQLQKFGVTRYNIYTIHT